MDLDCSKFVEEFWILDDKAALCPVHGGPQLPLVLYHYGILQQFIAKVHAWRSSASLRAKIILRSLAARKDTSVLEPQRCTLFGGFAEAALLRRRYAAHERRGPRPPPMSLRRARCLPPQPWAGGGAH